MTNWSKYKSKAGRAAMQAKKEARANRNQKIVGLYQNTNLFCTEIADVVKVDKQLVYDVLKKAGIDRTISRRAFIRYPELLMCDFQLDYLEN